MLDMPTLVGLIGALDAAASAHDKGVTLEALAAYLFGEIEGIEIRETNVNAPSEEVDLLLWNAKRDEVFVPWDSVIPVECKNWSAPVGASALDNFVAKIRLKHLSTGIFVAANGVTGDFVNGNDADRGAVYRLREHLTRDGIRVVVIRMDDIRAITAHQDLLDLIKDRYCKVYMHRVF
jgi:hypothetical protein